MSTEQAALGGLPEFKAVQRPVEMVEPRPGVRQPHAAVEVSQPRRRQPDAVVLDVELEHGAVRAARTAICPVSAWDQCRA